MSIRPLSLCRWNTVRHAKVARELVVTTVARLVWARDTGLLEEIETLRRDEAIGYRTGLEGFRGVHGFT